MNIVFSGITESLVDEAAGMFLELWPDVEFDEEVIYLREVIRSTSEDCFLLNLDGNYIGFILLNVRTDYVEGATSKQVAYIEGIYVREPYRRMGQASRMIEFAERWAREKGCSELGSDTEIDNQKSQEMHKNSGFKEVNRVVHYIKKLN
jgi:aminoglycoside 6'-N-acetyltransferase I